MNKVHACLFVAIIALFGFFCTTTPEVKSYPGGDYVASVQEYALLDFTAAFGTGFFVNSADNPFLITNRHVVVMGPPFPERKISVCAEDNKIRSVHGMITTVFDKIDIALIQVDSLPSGSKICFFEDKKTQIGDDVYYFGQPAKRGRFFLYFGKFSARNLLLSPIETGDAINVQAIGGNSGSPVLNQRNKCIGVLSSTIPGGNQTFIVPTSAIKKEFEAAGLSAILNGTYKGDLCKEQKGKIKIK